MREQGVALVIAITAVAILSVMLTEMHQTTTTGYLVAANQRDALRAEYMAKSGLNLTRLLVAAEPVVRQGIAPMYMAALQQPMPQLPVWRFTNILLQPFCDFESARTSSAGGAIDFRNAQGLEAPGTCEIDAFAENSRININNALSPNMNQVRTSLAQQLFTLLGGHSSPSPYDPLFQQRDAHNMITSREEVISSIIDWWDFDANRTHFDPGAGQVTEGGSEDNIYQRLDDPYTIKNAPFDSLEELRLVRGVTDDFWATFVEPRPEDPSSRVLTIYGLGKVNVNEAPAQVLLARVCSFVPTQPLCILDGPEAMKFVQLFGLARALAPGVPLFPNGTAFVQFMQGEGTIYSMLQGILQAQGMDAMLFAPLVIPPAVRQQLLGSVIERASIITIHTTGRVGRAEVRLHAVVNFHARWRPPPPLSGRMPALGVLHYYRVE